LRIAFQAASPLPEVGYELNTARTADSFAARALMSLAVLAGRDEEAGGVDWAAPAVTAATALPVRAMTDPASR
jgi:hypothetical protein